ncbi:MAG TPA: GNAT family N-acetyltransferase [Jatrophihabitans sp.]|nr:GNAT family N-acetyltransferase [Jatrophihabitans sp.]
MLDVRDATADRWDDVSTVMGTRGDPARCWCQYFHLRGKAWQQATTESNRSALAAQLDDSVPPGVVAYADGVPVGWCAVAPRSSYARLAYSDVATAVSDEHGLWAVTCFVVRVGHRRQGVSRALLSGAVDLARQHGARLIEAYPVDVGVKKASSAELYHGALSLFLGAGFAEVARPLSHRALVRLEVW